jgi:hypothetical protein
MYPPGRATSLLSGAEVSTFKGSSFKASETKALTTFASELSVVTNIAP